MNVNMVNLDREIYHLEQEINEAVRSVIGSTKFINGPKCRELEDKLCEYTGAGHCVLVGNGTDALTIALRAIADPGDCVAVPDFTFGATAEAVALNGCSILPAPVDDWSYQIKQDFLLDVEWGAFVTRAHKNVPRAVVPVGLFGSISWMGAKLPEIAQNRIIHDAAQAIGAKYKGFGIADNCAAACLSFYPTKTLGCYGDGGAVLTNDDSIEEFVRSTANHCIGAPYNHVHPDGRNSRLDEIQAAILLVKLKYLDSFIERKREIAAMYKEGLVHPFVLMPIEEEGEFHTYHQFTVSFNTSKDKRDAVRQELAEAGVQTNVYYPYPISKQRGFLEQSYHNPDCEDTQVICDSVLSLPICNYLTNDEVEYVIEQFNKATDKVFRGEERIKEE